MNILLSGPENKLLASKIKITGSKSESNRLLLLQALYPEISIDNISNADDVVVMKNGLQQSDGIVDIHHAGTAMRFLTAYFATREGRTVTLTGSARMQERPIGILVEALRRLNANITYLENEGFPPLQIKGSHINGNQVRLPADISSQYISALILVAPGLESGLEIILEGQITSVPYIKMTLALLDQLGVSNSFKDNTIHVSPKSDVDATTITVESDWSSASYYFSIIALAKIGSTITLSSYRSESLQGDSVVRDIYKEFGVASSIENNTLYLQKVEDLRPEQFSCDLANAPDLAQTIAVTCYGLGISCMLTGLHTLKIKETDRLVALQTELTKLGAEVRITTNSLQIEPRNTHVNAAAIETYNDHRMAMAFAPLAMITDLKILEAEVVSKSYPDFWQDLSRLGFKPQTN